MDILKNFSQQGPGALVRLSTGCFTVDRSGRIIASTLPQSFPERRMKEIGQKVLEAFRDAEEAQLDLSELVVHYPALKLSARELRGGAIVFLSPRSLVQNSP
jgi:hypothetical protein